MHAGDCCRKVGQTPPGEVPPPRTNAPLLFDVELTETTFKNVSDERLHSTDM